MKHGMTFEEIKATLLELNHNRPDVLKEILLDWLASSSGLTIDLDSNGLLLIDTVARQIANYSQTFMSYLTPIHKSSLSATQIFEDTYSKIHRETPVLTPTSVASPVSTFGVRRTPPGFAFIPPTPPFSPSFTPPLSALGLRRPQLAPLVIQKHLLTPVEPSQAPFSPLSYLPNPPSPSPAIPSSPLPPASPLSRSLSFGSGSFTISPSSVVERVTRFMREENINSDTVAKLLPLAKNTSDEKINNKAKLAVKLFLFIKSVDFFASKIAQKTGKTTTLSGTGGHGTETSAERKAYSALISTLISAVLNGFTIQEAQILAVGLFLHGSDIFYIAAQAYRGRLPAPSKTSDAVYMAKFQRAHEMREVHSAAFEILERSFDNAAKAGTQVSFVPRVRAIGLDMFEQVSYSDPPRGPFAAQMMRREMVENEMWEGEFTELASLCTGTSVTGCYKAFLATAGYDVSQHKYGLILTCCVKTYNYSKLSPFPAETEWVAPPGGNFQTFVFLREEGEAMIDFILRMFILLLDNTTPVLRTKILNKSLLTLFSEFRKDPTNPAFSNIKYCVFMWPQRYYEREMELVLWENLVLDMTVTQALESASNP